MDNYTNNKFEARGAISKPFEKEAFQKRQIKSLIAANYDLRLKNWKLQYLLQLEKRNTYDLLDRLYLLADIAECKADRKKLRQTVRHMEQQIHRRNYRNFKEIPDPFDNLYPPEKLAFDIFAPDIFELEDYEYDEI